MKVLILAQTPPPYHGQAVMQASLVKAVWNWCDKIHIRLDYSDSIENVGKLRFAKLAKLVAVVVKVYKERAKGKVDVLFYPPAGPHRVPFYRDFLTLFLVRWCTEKVVFQFHAGNFNGLFDKLNTLEKILAKAAYGSPDAAIVLLPSLENEVRWIGPRRTFIVPNGIEDQFNSYPKHRRANSQKILFVGSLSEKKGIVHCLEAAKILREADNEFVFNFVGEWGSKSLQKNSEEYVHENKLGDCIVFLGPKDGSDKWSLFSDADIFCMPTYDTEAMPMTIIEAMMMSLPVVTTRWRSIPHIIADGEHGFLVPTRDSSALADKLSTLLQNSKLGEEVGRRGRMKYLKEYSIENHLAKMEEVFKIVAGV